MNLYQASNQWSQRPDDERFWTLQDALAATQGIRDSAREALVPLGSLKAVASGTEDLELVGQSGQPAKFTHWAFGQVARTVGAPADYLRSLPAPLAAQNINYGIDNHEGRGQANLLLHKNGQLVVRSLTSDRYSRIWDADVIRRCIELQQYGWKTPPARPCRSGQVGSRIATQADVLDVSMGGLSVNVGDEIAPAGIYASDHDCFLFQVNEQRVKDGTDGGLSRGFFISNSEVGAAALKVTTFLYRHVCSNHIVWGSSNVCEIKVVHRGNADYRFSRELVAELRKYADTSASDDEAKIVSAQRCKLGNNKEEVLNLLFSRLRGDVSRQVIDESYERAKSDSNTDSTIDPNTAWGVVQGMTSVARDLQYTDARVKLERSGGKVLQMSF